MRVATKSKQHSVRSVVLLYHKEKLKKNKHENNNEHATNANKEASLVRALQDTMALTRLPTPEPSVFSGDPLKFVEWRTSFKALTERRCIDPADRLFYLQRYIVVRHDL